MCLGDCDPGGPHRCSSDCRHAVDKARAEAEAAHQEVADLEADLADAKRTYQSERAFREALSTRIRAIAGSGGRQHPDIARRFVLQQFVGRLAAANPDGWVVTGGTAMQYRSTEARETMDADLASQLDAQQVENAVQAAARRVPGQHGQFTTKLIRSDDGAMKYRITYLLDGKRFAVASIDINTGRDFPAGAETITPDRIVDIDDVGAPTPVKVYPSARHAADKVAAMYEKHGADGSPSSRAHDLADIVLISRCADVDAANLRTHIDAERRRRNITIPADLPLPSDEWRTSYDRMVTINSGRPRPLENVDAALTSARKFLGPILDGSVTEGRWDPQEGVWRKA